MVAVEGFEAIATASGFAKIGVAVDLVRIHFGAGVAKEDVVIVHQCFGVARALLIVVGVAVETLGTPEDIVVELSLAFVVAIPALDVDCAFVIEKDVVVNRRALPLDAERTAPLGRRHHIAVVLRDVVADDAPTFGIFGKGFGGGEQEAACSNCACQVTFRKRHLDMGFRHLGWRLRVPGKNRYTSTLPEGWGVSGHADCGRRILILSDFRIAHFDAMR